ncbi:MAG: hypothetical protein CMJ18_07730 [Phycisphaeraceae bacterium]|nr:hypothetical protein [Phycisphaeraceae bacterium]
MVAAMIAGANAKASRVAPCLTWDGAEAEKPAPSADQLAEAKLILMGAVKRWIESGAGTYTQQSAGPFAMSVDTRQRTGYNLWPSEIEGLQEICASGTENSSGAFSILPHRGTSAHLPWCALEMGGTYCSCGVDIAGVPIFELPDSDAY